nr:butyrophilin-like protein 1 [Chelonoidis abingdonii]
MEVLWRKIGSEYILVHKYSDEGSRDLPGESYQTRTELFQQEFSSGNISLKLKQLQVADAGTYQCLVRNPGWSQEAIAELRVAAVAPVFIDVLGPQGQGIGLACRVTGWFPKPELQWVGKNWQNLAMETVTSLTQDRENLYSVVSHVTVTEGEENGDISCIVRNGLLETERQSAIHLSETEKKTWESEYQELRETIDVERKTIESECDKLREKLDAERKAFEEECDKLHEKLDTEKKAFEAECSKLRETIESQEKEIKTLKTEYGKLREMIGNNSMQRKKT